jgi:hypothetical protein
MIGELEPGLTSMYGAEIRLPIGGGVPVFVGVGVGPVLQALTNAQASVQYMPVPGAYAQAAEEEHQPAMLHLYLLPTFCTI